MNKFFKNIFLSIVIMIASGVFLFSMASDVHAGTYYVRTDVNADPCEPGAAQYCDPADTLTGNDVIQYRYLAENETIGSYFELYYGASSGAGSDQASGGTKVPPDTADCSGSEPIILNGDPTINNAGTSYAATWNEANDRVEWSSGAVKINGQYVDVTWNLTFCSEAAGNSYDFNTFCTKVGGALVCDDAPEFIDEWGVNAPSTVYTQSEYKWYANADSLTPGSSITNENTAATSSSVSAPVRLRMNVGISGADLATSTTGFRLQWSYSDSGGWNYVGAIGSGDTWRFYDNASVISSTSIPSILLSSSNVALTYEEQNPIATNSRSILVGQYGEWDFALDPKNATNTTYYFRMVQADGSVLDTYTRYPEISFTPAVFNLSGYGFYQNFNGTGIGAIMSSATNTPAVLTSVGQQFRLRSLVHFDTATALQNTEGFVLQFGQKNGTCAASSYATVTAATMISFYDNAGAADGAALTASSVDPYHLTHVVVNQTYEESGVATNSQALIDIGQDGKWDYSLYDNGAVASTTYCMRMVRSSGEAFASYSYYPEITTKVNNIPSNDSLDLLNHNDGDELYASSTYTWRVVVSDADGYADINRVTLSLDYDSGEPQNFNWDQDDLSTTTNTSYTEFVKATSTCSGNSCTIDYYITMNWNWDNADDTATDAQVITDDNTLFATGTTSFLTDTFQVENDLQLTSVTYDSTQNPSASFTVTGVLDYEGVTSPNPPEDIADISIDPNWTATNYTDTDLDPDGSFSISGIVASSSLSDIDTFDIDIVNLPPGAGTVADDNNTMDIDRVQITNIVITNQTYNGTREWDENAGSMTATISAILEDAGTPIAAGDAVLVSTSFGGGASGNISETSATFSAGSAATTLSAATYAAASNNATYDNLYVTSVSAATNNYGTAFTHSSAIDEASERPDVGWDDKAPSGGAISWGTITTSIEIVPSGGTDDGSGVPFSKYYYAYDQGESFVALEGGGYISSNVTNGPFANNTPYAYILKIRDNVGNQTASNILPTPAYKYTIANTPGQPTVNNPDAGTIDVNPVSGGAEKEMAIYVEQGAACDGSGGEGYVQSGGTVSGTAAWQTDGAWGTITVTGLLENTQYAFCVKSRNNDNLETTFGTAQTGTTLGGVAFTQGAYRFYTNTASTGPAAVLAAQDQSFTMTTAAQDFRLRMLVHVANNNLSVGEGDFTLQYAEKQGTCAVSSYATVTAATAIAFYDNATVADGDQASATTTDPTHSGHTIRYETYEEANDFTNTITINNGEDGLWDFSLIDYSAANDMTYCLRAVTASGTPLSSYSVYPEFSTMVSPPMTIIFQEGSIFRDNVIFK